MGPLPLAVVKYCFKEVKTGQRHRDMAALGKLLVVTRTGNDGDEYFQPLLIESMRPADIKRHTHEAKTVVRLQSGRELAVADDFDELVRDWNYLLGVLT